MNLRKAFIIFDSVYLTAMTVCSILYAFLDTGKAITGQLALFQLLFTIVAIIIFEIRIRTETIGLPIYIYLLFAGAQVVPMFNWVWWYPTSFTIFSTMKMTFGVWFPIHSILLACGVTAPIIRRKLKSRVSE